MPHQDIQGWVSDAVWYKPWTWGQGHWIVTCRLWDLSQALRPDETDLFISDQLHHVEIGKGLFKLD